MPSAWLSCPSQKKLFTFDHFSFLEQNFITTSPTLKNAEVEAPISYGKSTTVDTVEATLDGKDNREQSKVVFKKVKKTKVTNDDVSPAFGEVIGKNEQNTDITQKNSAKKSERPHVPVTLKFSVHGILQKERYGNCKTAKGNQLFR